MRAILSKIVRPTCSPLLVAFAFIAGNAAAVLSDSPWWYTTVTAVALGILYGVLYGVLRRVTRRREHA